MIPLLLRLGLDGLNIVKVIGAGLKRFFNALNIQGWVGFTPAKAGVPLRSRTAGFPLARE